MKDLNERYWLSIVFSGWRTKQHLSATAFPLYSNRDFLRLLLSVCLTCNRKTNKLEETNFVFLKGFYVVYRQSSLSLKAKKSRGTECSSSVRGVSGGLSMLVLLALITSCYWIEIRESGGLLKQLIKMYEHPLLLGLIRRTDYFQSQVTKTKLPVG